MLKIKSKREMYPKICFAIVIGLGFLYYASSTAGVRAESYSYREIEELMYQAKMSGSDADMMAELAKMYESSDDNTKTLIAVIFYQTGIKSPEAKRVLLEDIHTKNRDLRINVQYALGRVSDDSDVVEALLDNMVNDPNAYFRDKSACALAYDQIHLSEQQKVRLYDGLIDALDDPKPQVRDIAIRALEIHTGQRKGFKPEGDESERCYAVKQWKRWLEEYRENL